MTIKRFYERFVSLMMKALAINELQLFIRPLLFRLLRILQMKAQGR